MMIIVMEIPSCGTKYIYIWITHAGIDHNSQECIEAF